MRDYLLLKWTLLNAGIGLLGVIAYRSGIVTQAWTGDPTWFTSAIFLFASVGFATCAYRTAECATLLSSRTAHGYQLSQRDLVAKEALRIKLDANVRPIEWLCSCLITIGLLAIIWGMKEGLYEVAGTSVQGADGAVQIVQVLIKHFTIALWPTVTGIALNLAVYFNVVLLQDGYDKLSVRLLERA